MVMCHSYVMFVYGRVYFVYLTRSGTMIAFFCLLRMGGKRSSFTYGLDYNNTYKKIEQWLVFVL